MFLSRKSEVARQCSPQYRHPESVLLCFACHALIYRLLQLRYTFLRNSDIKMNFIVFTGKLEKG